MIRHGVGRLGSVLVIALACAGCSGTSSGDSGSTTSASATPASTPAAVETTAPTTDVTTASTTQPAQTDVGIALAEPTGTFSTGTTLLHLRDGDRVDPLDPAGGQRELMVQLWYPAASSDGALAPYAPPAEAQALQAFYPVPAGAFTADTNSHLDAPAAAGSYPVVFFHHGLCGARTDSTVVAEQLASLGYVVAALGNTRETPAVEFPDGRVIGTADPAYCTAGGDPYTPAGQAVLTKLLQVRVDDVIFTADELTRLNSGNGRDASGAELPAGLAGSLDLSRMGIYGHSFGGATAAAVLAADTRFLAGIDLDGLVVGPVATAGLAKPFLVVGSSYHDPAFDPSWATFLPALTGWHQWIGVGNAGHYRFIDLGGSVKKWALDTTLKPQDPTTWTQVFGDIDDTVSQSINRDLVSGFFGEFLLGRSAPILQDPTAVYAELTDRTAEIAVVPPATTS